MKKCGRCGEVKDYSEFNKDRYTKTGLRSQCKECMKSERIALSDHYKKWRESPDKKEWYRKYRADRYEKDKVKISARNKARQLPRPDACEQCFSAVKVEAHHCDYSKPLDVMWLCAACHNAWHRENGEGLNG